MGKAPHDVQLIGRIENPDGYVLEVENLTIGKAIDDILLSIGFTLAR